MMEYRKLPKGEERLSTLGLGLGGIQKSKPEEIEAVIKEAMAAGINFFDLCAGGASVYAPFGRAIAGQREKIHFQLHLGAVYNKAGEYGWSRDLDRIQETLRWELQTLGTDYIDFGFLHCVDEESDWEDLRQNGIWDFACQLKVEGVIRHLGFSTHTPAVANRLLDTGRMEMMMYSLNPAYDLEKGDELGIGSTTERAALLRRCEAEGIGISVMKPFHGGQLLSAKTSPFRQALTKNQCLQYALDRPAVLSAVPGVRSLSDLHELLAFPQTTREQNDYSIIGQFTPAAAVGNCVYCNHCQPCPAGIDIGLVNKYYDLSLAGDQMAYNHYDKLAVKADACLKCGHCDRRCPFGVPQQARIAKIADYFNTSF